MPIDEFTLRRQILTAIPQSICNWLILYKDLSMSTSPVADWVNAIKRCERELLEQEAYTASLTVAKRVTFNAPRPNQPRGTFRRLFQAIGTSWAPNEARDAVLGYGLVRRISHIHVGTFDRDAINAFLVTLAAFERTWKIAEGRTGLWATLLKRESTDPLNNWAALTAFQNPETYPQDDFGLMFLPPAQTSQPWEIRTRWGRDTFMQVLLAIRPSHQNLLYLLAFADTFVHTRLAAQPLPGIPIPNEPQDHMYTASFIRGPSTPEAFSVDTTLTPAAPPGEMEIDGEQPKNDEGAPLPNQ